MSMVPPINIDSDVPGPLQNVSLVSNAGPTGDFMLRGVDLIAALRKTQDPKYVELADQIEAIEQTWRRQMRAKGLL
jgi:hypothetical protein